MNALLMQAGLDSYEINFNNLNYKSYRLKYMSIVLANRIIIENNLVKMGEDPELFWPVYILDEDFSSKTKARDAFVRTFLEPYPSNPRLVRFILRDLHYLLQAIHYVLMDFYDGRFDGSLVIEDKYCVPMDQRSPDLDPNTIVRMYQVDLLSYFMHREVDVDTSH